MFNLFAAAETPHISLVADKIFYLGPIPVTNSMMLGVLGYIAVIALMLYVRKSVASGKQNRFVIFFMWVFEGLLNTIEQVIEDKKVARRLAPLALTIFFFILVNYWLGILPFVGPVTYNGVPLFRGLAADLNVTFGLAIITMLTVQIYAIRKHGVFGNMGRYLVNPIKNPVGTFEGILEFIAEFSRGIALSLRLFGNVFAGEVLILMVGFLTNWAGFVALPPFLALELFVGAVQSYVFFMLTVVFVSLGTASHGAHDDDHSPAHDKPLEAVSAGSDIK